MGVIKNLNLAKEAQKDFLRNIFQKSVQMKHENSLSAHLKTV